MRYDAIRHNVVIQYNRNIRPEICWEWYRCFVNINSVPAFFFFFFSFQVEVGGEIHQSAQGGGADQHSFGVGGALCDMSSCYAVSGSTPTDGGVFVDSRGTGYLLFVPPLGGDPKRRVCRYETGDAVFRIRLIQERMLNFCPRWLEPTEACVFVVSRGRGCYTFLSLLMVGSWIWVCFPVFFPSIIVRDPFEPDPLTRTS